MSFGARALIRLGAIRHNFQTIKAKVPGAKVMAVIKANAYGHGFLPVARSLSDADCLAVARLQEAATLRDAGIETPIALLGGVLSETDLATAFVLDLQLAVHTESQIEWLERFGQADATVWLKIDTGMNRLGFRPDEAQNLIRRLQHCVADLRVMTHFANADNVQDDTTASQIERFRNIVSTFNGDISIANSPAIFGWEEALGFGQVDRPRRLFVVANGVLLVLLEPRPLHRRGP